MIIVTYKTTMSLSKYVQDYETSDASEEGECSSSDGGNKLLTFSPNQKTI